MTPGAYSSDETLRVRIDTVDFQSGLPAQLGFNIRKFTGWNDGAPVRRDAVQVAQGYGDFDVPDFKGSRTVTVEGFCLAKNLGDLGVRQGEFTGLGVLGRMRFTAHEFGRTLWGTARVDGTPEFDATDGLPRADFAVDLYFPDPRKYGVTRRFNPGDAAYHYGNAPATPRITVSATGSGMPDGYTVNGPDGRKFTVTAAVTAGHPHVIDMATGLVIIDGFVTYGIVSQGDTWAVPPGTDLVTTLSTSGSGTLSVAVVDTYV